MSFYVSTATFFFAQLWRMGPRCSSAETQVCHRSYIIAANQKWLPNILEFALSTFRTRNFITFWLNTTLLLHQQASFMISSFNRFIFSEISCMQVSDFCLSWSFASVKCTWFKTFMFESIVRLNRPENENRILKWKLQSVIEWKCSKNINLPSGDQYRIFTCILQK